jgi:lysophospholipase L1-like esterase
MDRWLIRVARVVGAAVGAFAGVVALQLLRLRRTSFLPGDPGFWVDHIVGPEFARDGEAPLRMLVFGDSTTVGVGVERAADAMPLQLARNVAQERRRRVHVTSVGWAGARAADLVRDQIPRAMGAGDASGERPLLPDADIVVVVVGANDATHRTPPHRYRASLRAALAATRDGCPDAELVVVGIPMFRGTLRHVEPLMWLTDQYARLLRPISRQEAARAGAAFADLAGRIPARMAREPGALASDGFHPSALGYRAWADVIADAVASAPLLRRAEDAILRA